MKSDEINDDPNVLNSVYNYLLDYCSCDFILDLHNYLFAKQGTDRYKRIYKRDEFGAIFSLEYKQFVTNGNEPVIDFLVRYTGVRFYEPYYYFYNGSWHSSAALIFIETLDLWAIAKCLIHNITNIKADFYTGMDPDYEHAFTQIEKLLYGDTAQTQGGKHA